LVATAIAADIVPMTGKIGFWHFGLQVINSDPRPGIQVINQIKKENPDITDVVL
jgi:single-stranded-DNA-specific exonuclease